MKDVSDVLGKVYSAIVFYVYKNWLSKPKWIGLVLASVNILIMEHRFFLW